jgi:ATP-dependent helicase HrpA
VLSRELFIRRALVEGDWETRHEFVRENARRVEEVEALEHRARRRDILAGDEARFAFLDARIPADVVSAAGFDRWWRDQPPDLLTYPRDVLVDPAAAAIDEREWPATWRQGDLALDLSYRFEPGAPDDGVTVHIPLRLLGQVRADRFEWLVPGLREELVTTLMRGLPKELRRPLVPIPATAARALAGLEPRRRPLAADLSRLVGVPAEAWDFSRLPPHLRMTFRIVDERRGVLAEGDDLADVRAQVRPLLREELTAAASRLERTGLTSWDRIGSLPREVTLRGTGQAVRAYPALVDEGSTVGVRVLETPAAQRTSMRAGTRRLLLLGVPSPARFVLDRLDNAARLALGSAPHGSTAAVLDDVTVAAVEALMAEAGGPAWDEAGFARLRDHVAGRLADTVLDVAGVVVRILDAAREVEARLEPLRAVPLQPARADVRAQLARLVRPGFVAATGLERLPDVERYLQAAARRLERLPDATATDRDRMNAIHELERAYRRRLAADPGAAGLREVPWMLEELRVSNFAQSLGTRGPISAKRVRRAIESP